MKPESSTTKPQRQIVPREMGGKWIAWSADGLRIIAFADQLKDCMLAAKQTGDNHASFERVPPAFVRVAGVRR